MTVFSSLVLALMFVLGRKIPVTGHVAFSSLAGTEFGGFNADDIVIFFAAFIGIFLMLKVLTVIVTNISSHRPTIKNMASFNKSLCVLWLIIFLLWIPWILALAPGAVLPDSLSSIAQATGNASLNNHHPIAFTLIVTLFVKLGLLMNNINVGVFLFSLTQAIVLSGTFAIILTYIYRLNVISKRWIIAFAVFLGVVPIYPIYAINVQKDTLFSCALLWLMFCSLKLYLSDFKCMRDRKFIVCFIITIASVCLFKNNGVYIIIGYAVLGLCIYKKEALKSSCYLLLFSLGYFLLISVGFHALGIGSDTKENYAIPLQQVGYVIAHDKDSIPETAQKIINQVMPPEEWKSNYTSYIVDNIKWSPSFNEEYFNEHSAEFIKAWGETLRYNFVDYVKAYCLETYGFWKPGVQCLNYGYADTYVKDNSYGIERKDLVLKATGIDCSGFFSKSWFKIGSGTLLWLTVISLSISYRKNSKSLFIYCPMLLCWGTIMIATPVAFSLRYVLIFMFALPLIFLIPIICTCYSGECKNDIKG